MPTKIGRSPRSNQELLQISAAIPIDSLAPPRSLYRMNPTEPLGDAPPPPPVIDFKDRRRGLMVFGILEILLGVLCLLMVGLMVLGQAMASRAGGGAAFNAQMMVPAMVVYVTLAAGFVWLGIGSIRYRRWARALVLILAWFWLCVGVITIPLLGVVMPRILAGSAPNGQGLPPGMLVTVMVFQLVFMTLFFVVLPGVLVFFYQSRHVKATCEARDPVRRWTDACPLPALAVACSLWLGSIMMLAIPFAYRGTMPCFGTIVTGLPGTLLALALAALFFWLGGMWYRLKAAGWWWLLATLVVLSISNFITFSRVDLIDLYQKMGYPEAQLEMIRRQGWLSSGFMLWNSLVWLVPMLGYLVWVRRFFRPAPEGR